MSEGCQVEIAGLSDRGLVRETNEDSILVGDLDQGSVVDFATLQSVDGDRGPILILCDGMGGAVGGEVASALACQSIFEATLSCPNTDDRAVLARNLRRAVRLANQAVVAAAKADKSLRGMGTTVSVAALAFNTVVVAQVGDSRAYVLRGKTLSQITRDQSVVSALVHSGQLAKERAAFSMQRGRILQAVGSTDDVEVSLSIAELRAGDRILLCSDGLHDAASHEAIAIACATSSLEDATKALLELAHAQGGMDNISVLLAEVRGGTLRDPLEGEEAVCFTEFDPNLEGESALSTTSMVGRRLAHQAGIRKEAGPARLSATRQHPAIPEGGGPAQKALAARGRVHGLVWFALACVFVAMVYGLWRL